MLKEYTFTAQLAILVTIDVALTVLNSYIPHELSPVRALVAVVQLAFMAATMTLAMRRVLEDY